MVGDKRSQKTTIALSFAAYAGLLENNPFKIYESLKYTLDNKFAAYIGKQEIVWGPAVHTGRFQVFSDALMYVVQNTQQPSEYTIVIRGTNPICLSEIIFKSLRVSRLVKWNSKDNTSNAKVAIGAFNGLRTLQNLRPESCSKKKYVRKSIADKIKLPGQGMNLLEFLSKIISKNGERITINVTGHSQGGALSYMLALWLYEKFLICPAAKHPDIYVYTYAAPAVGNQEFAEYFNRVMGDKCYVHYNPLDPSYYLFNEDSLKKLPALFAPDTHMDFFMSLTHKWISFSARGKGYTHVGIHKEFASEINNKIKGFQPQYGYQHTKPYVHRFVEIVNKESNGKMLINEEFIKWIDLQGTTSPYRALSIFKIIYKSITKIFELPFDFLGMLCRTAVSLRNRGNPRYQNGWDINK
ncbi:MAG: hypothetical protein N3B21_05715 [Clostridia bacterium]|nr:hypothetical protein [Clostridia bacterium]